MVVVRMRKWYKTGEKVRDGGFLHDGVFDVRLLVVHRTRDAGGEQRALQERALSGEENQATPTFSMLHAEKGEVMSW